jgi:hypothetical protein
MCIIRTKGRKIEIPKSKQKDIIRWLMKQAFKKRFITQDRCWHTINEIQRSFKSIVVTHYLGPHKKRKRKRENTKIKKIIYLVK